MAVKERQTEGSVIALAGIGAAFVLVYFLAKPKESSKVTIATQLAGLFGKFKTCSVYRDPPGYFLMYDPSDPFLNEIPFLKPGETVYFTGIYGTGIQFSYGGKIYTLNGDVDGVAVIIW